MSTRTRWLAITAGVLAVVSFTFFALAAIAPHMI
jgi:hypothetical protein